MILDAGVPDDMIRCGLATRAPCVTVEKRPVPDVGGQCWGHSWKGNLIGEATQIHVARRACALNAAIMSAWADRPVSSW